MQVNNSYYTPNLRDIKELPEPTKLDKETYEAIKRAQAKVDEERKEYNPTHKQLEENPWLKNAANGLTKVSDLIEGFERGINGSGKFTLSKLSSDSFDVTNKKGDVTATYGIFSEVKETTTHLAWDNPNYTRNGTKETTGMTLRFTYTSYETHSFNSANIDFNVENADKEVDFNKLTDKLKSDKEFEKNFLGALNDYIINNDSSKLINYLKQALDIVSANLSIKEPGTIYGDAGQLSSIGSRSHLSILA